MPSPYQQHVARWSGCRACALCDGRKRVVLARGSVPCDVLFCGEAPGESENIVGRPFCGPAGQLLDRIIRDAGLQAGGLRLAFTNVVACVPRDEDGGKAAEPLPAEIKACAPRLVEFVRLANPRLIVCVGALARDYLDLKMHGNSWRAGGGLDLAETPRVSITHPAAILRANIAARGLLAQRCIVTLATAAEELTNRSEMRP